MDRTHCPFCKVHLVPLDDGEAGSAAEVLRCLLCGYALVQERPARPSSYEDIYRRRLAMLGEVERDDGD